MPFRSTKTGTSCDQCNAMAKKKKSQSGQSAEGYSNGGGGKLWDIPHTFMKRHGFTWGNVAEDSKTDVNDAPNDAWKSVRHLMCGFALDHNACLCFLFRALIEEYFLDSCLDSPCLCFSCRWIQLNIWTPWDNKCHSQVPTLLQRRGGEANAKVALQEARYGYLTWHSIYSERRRSATAGVTNYADYVHPANTTCTVTNFCTNFCWLWTDSADPLASFQYKILFKIPSPLKVDKERKLVAVEDMGKGQRLRTLLPETWTNNSYGWNH